MQPVQLTKQQQQAFGQRLNDELGKVIMSWDNDVRKWHDYAIMALNYASVLTLQIPQAMFADLLKEEKQGLNLNVVQILCNNLEARTPKEMGLSLEYWAEVLILNQKIAEQWKQMVIPIERKILKEFEIMNNRPNLVIAEA